MSDFSSIGKEFVTPSHVSALTHSLWAASFPSHFPNVSVLKHLTLIRHIQNWAHLSSQTLSFSFSVVSSNTAILWVTLSHNYKKHFQFSFGTSCVINHQSLFIFTSEFPLATSLTSSFSNYSLREYMSSISQLQFLLHTGCQVKPIQVHDFPFMVPFQI